MTYIEIEKKVSEWIYAKQKASAEKSNLLKTIDASDKLEELGIDGFAKEIKCGDNEKLSAFMTARNLIRICENYYHEQEIWG